MGAKSASVAGNKALTPELAPSIPARSKSADAALIRFATANGAQPQTESRSTQNRKKHYHHEINHYHCRHHIVWLVTNDVRSRPDIAKTRRGRKAGSDSWRW